MVGGEGGWASSEETGGGVWPPRVTVETKPDFWSWWERCMCCFVKGIEVVPRRALEAFCRWEQTCERLTRDMVTFLREERFGYLGVSEEGRCAAARMLELVSGVRRSLLNVFLSYRWLKWSHEVLAVCTARFNLAQSEDCSGRRLRSFKVLHWCFSSLGILTRIIFLGEQRLYTHPDVSQFSISGRHCQLIIAATIQS